MSYLKFSNAAIKGIAACVPQNEKDNASFGEPFTEKDIKKIIRSTGIQKRRFAEDGQCGSDFACHAAEKLLHDMNIDPPSIGVLIYLTQTPDYLLIPPTSCILQNRLHLPKNTAAFDINMNCSGFVYALSTAFAYASASKTRVLLLCGETLTKVFSEKDKTTGLLFGDGGAAVLIDYVENVGDSFFSLNTDGSNHDAIIIPEGGYRKRPTTESLIAKQFPDGSVRSAIQGQMDGMRVFDFTQEAVPSDLSFLLERSGHKKEEIDYFFFHQANKFMINLFAMNLNLEKEKCPVSLDRFGNTSTVSIPLGISADFGKDGVSSLGKVIFSGFGGGLSWGTALLDLNNCYLAKLEEYQS